MNISTSECSSGCESGWTAYLDHLSNSTNPYNRQNHQGKGANVNEDDQEDEDLSMVSDASSGPPHFHPQCYGYGYGYGLASPLQQDKNKSKSKETRMKQHHNLCLDDTATSPMLNFSQGKGNAVHYSAEHFSTAHIEEETTPKKKATFFKSSIKGKSGSLLGMGRKRQ